MPSTSIAFGTILILIGILGAVAGQLNGRYSNTALIPAAFGVLMAACGFIAWKMPNLRKHLMHGALLVALLGVIGTLFSPGIRNFLTTGHVGDSTSFVAQVSMGAVCVLFLILGIKSFIDARRNRDEA